MRKKRIDSIKPTNGDFHMTALREAWQRLLLHPTFIPIALLTGIVIRLLVAIFLPVEPMSDSAWYVTRAKEISEGLGYQENGLPTAFWPIGWPAILAGGYALVGSMRVTIVLLNLIGSLAIMLLILWYGTKLTGHAIVGRVALLAYAFYPNHIAYTSKAATEIVYTAIVMGAFALMIQTRNRVHLLFVSGLIFGGATLVKPQTIAFPVGAAIALFLIYRSFSWPSMIRATVIVYIGLLLVVLPWTYRNLVVLGEPVLVSTNGGVSLLMGANDQVTGRHFDYHETPVFSQLGIPWENRVARQVELDKLQTQTAISWIRENKWYYIAWMPKKILMLWSKDTDGFWAYDYSYPDSTRTIRVLQVANQLYYAVVVLLSIGCAISAAIGIVKRSENSALLGFLFCMPVFVSLIAAVFTGQIRYHFPAMPFLFVAGAWMLLKLLGNQDEMMSRPDH
jgi:4-amino-4-deoxy-L-arabinose transferase-like glycosyltransferase